MSNSKNKVKLLVIFITIVVKILGFSRDLILAHYFGASSISDAYLVATTLPISIFSFVGVAITSTFIPITTEMDESKKNKFITSCLIAISIISVFVIIFVNVFPSYITKLLAYGFDSSTSEITISMLRVSICNVFFSGLIFLFVAYLNSKKSFLITASRSIPFDIVIILSIVLSYHLNSIFLLTVGIVLSVVVEFLFVSPFVFKNGFKIQKPDKESWKSARYMVILSIPAIIGASVGELNGIIDRSIASTLDIGSVSSLTYSSRILSAIIAIFVTSLLTVFFPKYSEDHLKGLELYKETVSRSICEIGYLIIPLSLGCIFLGNILISILFGHGNVGHNSLNDISETFVFYSFSLFFWGMRDLFNMVFYSQKRTIFPCVVTVLSLTLNIGLNFTFVSFLGIKGLALATTIATIVNFSILFTKLLFEKTFNTGLLFLELLKQFLAAVIMSLALIGVIYLLNGLSNYLIFAVSFAFGVFVYVLFTILFKSKTAVHYLSLLKGRFKR